MRCTRAECAAEHFPRLDPAIIVLVTDGARALLGRQAAWPAGRYSALAGFVEVGESVEEAVAELAPHVRKTEQIVEHVRVRMAQQLCGDLTDNGVLRVLRLGSKWDLVFHQALKRDAKGEVVEFDIDPRSLEEFSEQASQVIREFMDRGLPFVLVTSPETRSYVRMIIERLFATLPVLSHVELAKGIEIKILGSIS